MVYFVMTSLGEMATYLPNSGSFSDYGGRYVDPAFWLCIRVELLAQWSDYHCRGFKRQQD